jgi:Mg2+/Co2+ transporter CorB
VLENIWVREEKIIDIISILDSNKATGPDKISYKMIISIGICIFLCKWLKMFLNIIFSNILLIMKLVYNLKVRICRRV